MVMKKGLLWGNLIHLSYNMWCDRMFPDDYPESKNNCSQYVPMLFKKYIGAKPYLRFDDDTWNGILHDMHDAGMNMIVLDLGDAVRYRSHPEIAVRGAWSVKKLRAELANVRRMGIEPIPKLNFSSAHDAWMGAWERRLSTPEYCTFCTDIIAEVIDIFDKPRFFHIGMDEETYSNQVRYRYAVVRQYDLWWHDLDFYMKCIERSGVRPWMWSDYVWHYPDVFLSKMSKRTLQSNWHYGEAFSRSDLARIKNENVRRYYARSAAAYKLLGDAGYDHIPTGSIWASYENFPKTVEHCMKVIPRKNLLGFLTAPWAPTLGEFGAYHRKSIENVKDAMQLI